MISVLAAAILGPTHVLQLHLGDSWRSTLETTYIDDDKQPSKVDFEDFKFKVIDEDGTKWKVQIERRFIKTVVMGVDVPPPAKATPQVTIAIFDQTTCQAFPVAEATTPDFRLSRFFQFQFPPPDPEVETQWTSSKPHIGPIQQLDLNFELRSVATQDIWDASATEFNGATATGVVEIKSNGLPSRIEWFVKHKVIPGEEEPTDIKLKYLLVEFKPAKR